MNKITSEVAWTRWQAAQQSVAEFIRDTYPADVLPLCRSVLCQKPGFVKQNNPDYYNNIKRCTRPRTESIGRTSSDKSPAIKSSKIFSLPNRKGTTLPVVETVSTNGSLFSTNRVSCVAGHFYGEERNPFPHEPLSHVMFTAFKTADRAENMCVTWTANWITEIEERVTCGPFRGILIKVGRIYYLVVTSEQVQNTTRPS